MTTRRAYVAVRNDTSEPLLGVSVLHKYSDEHKSEKQWGIVQPGELTSETLEADYNTGFWTTGRDWWLITWFSADMQTIYFSDPNNFRSAFDGFDNVIGDIASATAGIVAGSVAAGTGPGAIAAAAAAAVAAKTVTSTLFNSETTEGFKQHILREEDEGERTEIVINADRTITFKSKSGDSDTVSSSKPAPIKKF